MACVDDILRSSGLKPASEKKSMNIEFVYDAPEAKEVYLAGSFNNWDRHGLRMKKNRRGQWKATVNLAPGKYPYKFIADGNWTVGSLCPEVVVDDSGATNCAITVEPQLAA